MALDAVSWSSCLTTKLSSKDAKWFITGLFSRCTTAETQEPYWIAILWSLFACVRGQHPMSDIHGEDSPSESMAANKAGPPLMDGLFFVVWQFRGDLDYFSNHIGLKHFSNIFLACGANAIP